MKSVNGVNEAGDPLSGAVALGGGPPAGVLDQDVGCPTCGYNLRGLAKDVATCPECGTTTDVAQLIVRRWDKPWHKAPKYNQLCLPAAMLFVCALGWLLTIAVIDTVQSGVSRGMVAVFWLGLGLVAWAVAIAWVSQRLGGRIGVGYALFVHLSVVGYVGGLIFTVIGGITLFVAIVNFRDSYFNADVFSFAVYIAMFVGGIAGFFAARWIERVAAKYCIRLYLRRPTTSD
jgi:hypothetical protein